MSSLMCRFLLMLASIATIAGSVWAYPVAYDLQYPLNNYVVGVNGFDSYNILGNSKWHLGDDCAATAGDEVYAIGDGVVRHAQYHSPIYNSDGSLNVRNYGGMYIIEHNVNGEKVCAIYVHMNYSSFSKVVGDEVLKGEYLGEIGDPSQNGGWSPHFHFGIRKGEYPSNPNEYIYGDWIFSGYSSNEVVLNDWYDPSVYLAGHLIPQVEVQYQYPVASQFQSSWDELVHGFAITPAYQWGSLLRQDFQYTFMTYSASNGFVLIDGTNWTCPGMTESGWNYSVSPYFVKAYNDHGRANAFGNAYSDAGNSKKAHLWSQYYIQNFQGGDLGECALTLDPSLPSAEKQAAPIHGVMWNWFRYNGGPNYLLSNGQILGCPVEPEQYANEGVNFDLIQVTSNGYMYWDEWNVTAETNGTVSGSVLPGDGVSITYQVYALSQTQVFVNFSSINGAANYQIRLNGSYYDETTGLEYVISGLAPETTYNVRVIALDESGFPLASTPEISVTTDPEEQPSGLFLTINGNTTYVDISWPVITGASYAEVYRNGELVDTTPNTFTTVYGLSSGQTYTFLVEVYDSNSTLLAFGSKNHQTGQNAYLRAEANVTEVTAGQIITATVYGVNGTSGVMNNFTVNVVSVEPSSVLTAPATATPLVTSIPAGATVKLYEFTVQVGNTLPALSEVSIAAAAQFNAPVPGLTTVFRSGIVRIPIAKWSDMIVTIDPENLSGVTGESPYFILHFENYSNSNEVAQPFQVYLDGVMIGSGLTPELKARQIWTTNFPLGEPSVGYHEVRVIVDPLDNLSEVNELNNESTATYRVLPNPIANLTVSDVTITPANTPDLRKYQDGVVEFNVSNIKTAVSEATQVEVTVGSYVVRLNVPVLQPGESVTLQTQLTFSAEGENQVIVLVDPDDVVLESSESDNAFTGVVNILPAYKPDAVISLEPTKFGYGVDEDVVLTLVVYNEGFVDCPSVTVEVYDEAQNVLQSLATGPITAGALYMDTINLGMMLEGDYYFDARVDGYDYVSEEDENNNWDFALLNVSQDGFETAIIPLERMLDLDRLTGVHRDEYSPTAKLHSRLSYNREGRSLAYADILAYVPAGYYIVEARYMTYLLSKSEVHDSNFVLSLESKPYDLGYANWNESSLGESWTVPNGGIQETGKSITFVPSTVAVNEWLELNATELVQTVVDGTVVNEGILLSQEDSPIFSGNQEYFLASDDYSDPRLWPYLVIKYAAQEPVAPEPVTLTMPITNMLELNRLEVVHKPENSPTIKLHCYMSYGREGLAIGRVDLSGVPTGAVISSAKYWVYVTALSETINSNFVLSIEPQPYDEFFANWNYRLPGETWSGILETGKSVTLVPGSFMGGAWLELEATALVQAVADGQIANNGILLSQDVVGVGNQEYYLATEDYPDVNLRPYMVITYEP